MKFAGALKFNQTIRRWTFLVVELKFLIRKKKTNYLEGSKEERH